MLIEISWNSVAAGVSPATEPGILPGGLNLRHIRLLTYLSDSCTAAERRDAALYVRRDA